MTLCLDTSVLIALERKDAIVNRLRELAAIDPAPPVITFMAYFEYVYGLMRKAPRAREQATAFIQRFPVLQTTKTTAHVLAKLRAELEEEGIALPLADLMIASQVMEHNLTLVTRDGDFSRIHDLNAVVL